MSRLRTALTATSSDHTRLAAADAATAQEKLKVVASFSILGDMVARVGGDRIELATLVGPGGDAHVFEPRPVDAQTVANAQVMIVNGLGFEGWIDRLVEASGSTRESCRVVVSEGVETIARARGASIRTPGRA